LDVAVVKTYCFGKASLLGWLLAHFRQYFGDLLLLGGGFFIITLLQIELLLLGFEQGDGLTGFGLLVGVCYPLLLPLYIQVLH
jgi:hypothetical protein